MYMVVWTVLVFLFQEFHIPLDMIVPFQFFICQTIFSLHDLHKIACYSCLTYSPLHRYNLVHMCVIFTANMWRLTIMLCNLFLCSSLVECCVSCLLKDAFYAF